MPAIFLTTKPEVIQRATENASRADAEAKAEASAALRATSDLLRDLKKLV